MAGLTLPSIRDLDLPWNTTNWAFPSPPLTPTSQSFCSSHGGWQSRRSSVEETPSEALTLLSRSALGYLEPGTDHESRRGSTVSTVSTSESLPSMYEFVRGLVEMGLPTPLPSPTFHSHCLSVSPDSEQSVPWSRSRIPDNNAASELCSLLRNRRQEGRIQERRKALTQSTRPKVQQLPAKQRHPSDARVKKPKTALNKSKPKCPRAKRSNQEYTPIQECFIIYHRSERKFGWEQIAAAYNEWNMGSGEPFRSHGALSCIYYRTNYRIPMTTPDGLLVLRVRYGEEEEARIQAEMEAEVKRLEEEAARIRAEKEAEARRLEMERRLRSLEELKDEGIEMDDGPSRSIRVVKDEGYVDGEDQKRDEKKKKDAEKKKKHEKKAEVHYPYSVHGDVGIPTVEYSNSSTKVRDGGDVPLLHRFPEVLADERHTWVLPEHRERAKELAARRIQQRLEWREWYVFFPGPPASH
ncbi:hypothetical protein QBC37DRAFT_396264 [Rhypophila decipiens]|uniref:Uncharacterized protein n=1 Tax=Rhypophila decipiens TaxID=261697 RepID=A0AAN7BC82_9PEZI|nr:hypothetical protein QBC37DRAFT_396264 [Rhypophila decipiens]